MVDPREVLEAARVLWRARVLQPYSPERLFGILQALRHYGFSLAGGFAACAARFPERIAVADEAGTLSYLELDRRANRLAHSLARAGVSPGDGVAVLCRNHRGFVEISAALAKLGADVVYLNTSFAAPQLAEVVARESIRALVHDEEFADVAAAVPEHVPRFVAWCEGRVPVPTLDELIQAGDPGRPPPPPRPGRLVILTAGTTGTPKGVGRSSTAGLGPIVALLSRIPLREGDTTVVAAPMFHSWGLGHLELGLLLGATVVLQRRFDPAATLQAVAQHRADNLVAVPAMLARILELPTGVLDAADTSSLRTVPVSGSALPAVLATEFLDRFGDVLYNLYGSTEVAWATIATPADLRAAPGTAGRPPPATVVKVLDGDGNEVPPGRPGRIFVGNEMLFHGYTGGGNKEVIDGLMSTGDIGRFDPDGRLFVEGRVDDMIVSGGENVFPREVEDLLVRHDAIREAAVVGIEDAEFQQRLAAFVVKRPGAALSADDVRSYVKANLARYKVPREVVFLDELPRNPAGKVLKRRLRETAPAHRDRERRETAADPPR